MLGFLGIFAGPVGVRWVGDEEGILLVAGRMLLGNEEGVKVPEAGFDIPRKFSKELALKLDYTLPVCWHLLESHFEENLSELMPYFVHYGPILASSPAYVSSEGPYEDVEPHYRLVHP